MAQLSADSSASVLLSEKRWDFLAPVEQQEVRSLFHSAFPPEERPEWNVVVDSGYRLWVAKTEQAVVGFATITNLPNAPRAAYLQFFAVSEHLRSRGIGTVLLHKLTQELRHENCSGIFLEIEHPFAGDSTQARRRLRFYEQWGAKQLDCLSGYFIANFQQEGSRIPMLLLWKPVVESEQPKGEVLRRAITDIYEIEYARVADVNHYSDLLSCVIC